VAGNKTSGTIDYALQIFESVATDGPATRAELAERTALKRHQVTLAVDTMIEWRWLRNGDGIIKIGERPLFLTAQSERQKRARAAELTEQANSLHIPHTTQSPTSPTGIDGGSTRWTPAKIKALRARLSLSQRAAATKWGIPLGSLKQYERGAREIITEHKRILDTVDTNMDTGANA